MGDLGPVGHGEAQHDLYPVGGAMNEFVVEIHRPVGKEHKHLERSQIILN